MSLRPSYVKIEANQQADVAKVATPSPMRTLFVQLQIAQVRK